MERMIQGMLAWSQAGHDKDILYLICGIDGEFVYLSDGRLKRFEKPKKKNIKHIQVMKKIPDELAGWDGSVLRNEEIRKILKKYEEGYYV